MDKVDLKNGVIATLAIGFGGTASTLLMAGNYLWATILGLVCLGIAVFYEVTP